MIRGGRKEVTATCAASVWRSPALRGVAALACCGLLGCASGSVGGVGAPQPRDVRSKAQGRYAQLLQAGAPALQVAVEKTDATTIVLREVSRGGVDTYLSSDGIALKLRRGVLVGTAGLGGDMSGSDVSDTLALLGAGQTGTVKRFHTFLNGENKAITRTYLCLLGERGPRSIQVGTRSGALRTVATTLVAEECRSLDQSFENLYWVARPSGQVVQSRQWAGDFAGMVVMRVVVEESQ
ncbi:YjbF family lipoprotein [Vannielia litorea]|uniref:Group 4 capsule polysaccharide lipoprotein gfcB, YjbF n=1 Tax=Vannielia litorea TaxID=1217970 RepID=A0A1N6G5R1_9RHOB|nr:YjbF family lipoprotein [Vannielia litorea]SIO02889.1 Group 4 capsule polysaccharide lipoprotein gfcB, YjbF [Vannielia litorea]